MKAVIHDRYGSYDCLKIREIAMPAVTPGQVLISVRAAGLHIGDCFGVRGSPLMMRMATGWFKPARGIPGYDVAGRVDAVGSDVTRFRPGDDVFGVCTGACAEYVCTGEDRLCQKPTNATFTDAAAVPTSALAALHALRDVARVQPGQKILINGASGGVGTFAVQIARVLGAHVTGVCGPGNVELVRSIGADRVIDYSRDDFTRSGTYDAIFDNVENRSLADCRRALTPGGTLVLNSGTGAHGIALLVRLVKPLALSAFVRQNLRRFLSVPSHDDLALLKELVEAGKVKPVLDRKYSLRETADALRYIETGHARGKVVVEVQPS